MHALKTRKWMTGVAVGAAIVAMSSGPVLAQKGPNEKANDRAKEKVQERSNSADKAKSKEKGKSADKAKNTSKGKSGEKGRTAHNAIEVGAKAPGGTLTTIDGESVELASMYGDGPLVITFYRGGWCPFCNKAMAKWAESQSSLQEAGARWLAITPEKPSFTKETSEKFQGLTVLSDANFEASKAFGLYFDLDEQIKGTYKGYGIDLEEHNANGLWSLPHPATFIIDSDGIVQFVEVHVDYKQRTDPQTVLAALKNIN